MEFFMDTVFYPIMLSASSISFGFFIGRKFNNKTFLHQPEASKVGKHKDKKEFCIWCGKEEVSFEGEWCETCLSNPDR